MRNFYWRSSVFKILVLLALGWPAGLAAQTVPVQGTVQSLAYQLPLAGVTVKGLKSQVSTRTDAQGQFSLHVPAGEVLVFSRHGYVLRQQVLGSQQQLQVVLQENPLGPDSTYQQLYGGSQDRRLSTAAVGEIYTAELEKTFSRSTTGLLTGRLAGLYGNQSTGEPGADNVAISLRGANPLVMVDGTPQSFGAINPEQIESITLMKDALSAAMLGMRASNGVLYITTKKGRPEAQRVSLKAITGVQRPLKLPQGLPAWQYAQLYNEARANDGLSPAYTEADLAAYRDGSDPMGHPNINWYDQVLEKQSAFSRYDLAVSGGSKLANYFVNLDYLDQGGLLKTSPENTYNTNADFKRYALRSNVGINLSRLLTAQVNMAAQIQNGNEPGATVPTIFSNMLSTPNNAYPVLNPDNSLAGTDAYRNNIYGQVLRSGYRPYTQAEFKTDLSLKANLDDLIQGLWARGSVAYKSYLFEALTRSKGIEVYQMNVNAAGDTSYTRHGPAATAMVNTGGITSRNRSLFTELALGYSRQLAGHGLNLLLHASNDNTQSGDLLDENYRGLAGRLSYNYKGRYLAEVAAGYNGIERFPENKRYGFFPAFGLGWNLAQESFLQAAGWLDLFKLRLSYGKTGNVNAGYFAYNQYYNTSTAYNIGNNPTNAIGIAQGTVANPLLTWEKANKLNLGLDLALLQNRFSLSADYFDHDFYDLVQARNTGSTLFGAAYPSVNIGKLHRRGVDLQIQYQGQLGDFQYFLAPNASLLRSVTVYNDEVSQPYAWMQRTGLPAGQPFGYLAEGLFQSQGEADDSPTVAGYTARAGDIRYRDLNGDGLIDANDVTAIGHQKPLLYYGLNLGFSGKGFDFTALLQGVENRQFFFTGAQVYEFQNNGRGQAFAHHLHRWTPETAATATYPRLTIGQNINNHLASSYWLKSGDYLRLRNVELGYTLPASLVRRVKLGSARVFVNATNLATWAAFDEVDPETNTGGYPMLQTLSGGLNIKF
ncbi:MAG: SusC/RagA family TonB-linked outer membrane protein [Adhaeribacter sp.]